MIFSAFGDVEPKQVGPVFRRDSSAAFRLTPARGVATTSMLRIKKTPLSHHESAAFVFLGECSINELRALLFSHCTEYRIFLASAWFV